MGRVWAAVLDTWAKPVSDRDAGQGELAQRLLRAVSDASEPLPQRDRCVVAPGASKHATTARLHNDPIVPCAV